MIYYGIVEDIYDPEKQGRVKVRVHGVHDARKDLIKTEDLPWSLVMGTTTSPGISGVGHSSFLLQGSWVVGAFIDVEHQDFMVMGSLPTKSGFEFGNTQMGFTDPNGKYPRNLEEEDNNLRVRGRPDPNDYEVQGNYQPRSAYAPQYPYNHVYESESGHIKEYDDTPGSTRIRERHNSGTYYEVQPGGSKIERVVADNYELILGNDTVEVKGNVNIIVSEDVNLSCAGSVTANVGENVDFLVQGDVNGEVRGNVSMRVGPKEPDHVTYADDGTAIHKAAPEGYTKNQAIAIWNPPIDIKITTEISGSDMLSSGSKLLESEDADGNQRQYYVSMSISTSSDGTKGDAEITISDMSSDGATNENTYFMMDVSLYTLSQIASAFDANDYNSLARIAQKYAIDEYGNSIEVEDGFKPQDIKLENGNWVYKGESLPASFGHIDLHIEGDVTGLIDRNVDLTVLNNAKVDVKKDADIDVGGNVDLDVGGNMDTLVQGTYTCESKGNMKFTAPRIDINE